jgi:hypothetical protein
VSVIPQEILDLIEEKTGMSSGPADYAPDARQYHVTAPDADVHAFEPMLDRIVPDWADHITLVSPG